MVGLLSTTGGPVLWQAGGRGINLGPFGFATSYSATTWTDSISASDLTGIMADTNVDWVRIPFNPTALLAATPGAAEDAILANIAIGVDAVKGKDKRILLDCHVNDGHATWDMGLILADYPSSTKWNRFLAVTTRMATFCAGYNHRLLAYQQFNEMPGTQSNLSAKVKAIYDTFRATNTRTTVVVGADQYSAIEGLPSLSTATLSGNYLIAVTPYISQVFTHQGIPGTLFQYSGLTFPPDTAQRTSIKAQIDASALSAPDKTTAKSLIDLYMDIPFDAAWMGTQLDLVVAAATSRNLSVNRMLVTEFGANGNSAATVASRAAWYTAMRSALESRSLSWALWEHPDTYFGLGGYPFNATLLAALYSPVVKTGTYVSGNVIASDPSVAKVGSTYHMIHTELGPSPDFRTILRKVTSTDRVNWTPITSAINPAGRDGIIANGVPGSTLEARIETGDAISSGGSSFVAYYSGYPDPTWPPASIFLLTSSDGVAFTRPFGNDAPVLTPTANSRDSDACFSPCVVYTGAQYIMFYTGHHYTGSTSPAYGVYLLAATSSDATTWTKQSTPLFSPGDSAQAWMSDGIAEISVARDPVGGMYIMFFTGLQGQERKIGFARASNPLGPWSFYPSPVIVPGGGSSPTNETKVIAPSVIIDGNAVYVWYGSFATPPDAYVIGLATASLAALLAATML